MLQESLVRIVVVSSIMQAYHILPPYLFQRLMGALCFHQTLKNSFIFFTHVAATNFLYYRLLLVGELIYFKLLLYRIS